MPNSNPTETQNELKTLRTANHRLRLSLAAIVGAMLGAGVLGFASDAAPNKSDPVSITTDGTYLYALRHDGYVYRMDIETREDANKQRPDVFYTKPINEWNLFSFGLR